MLPSKFSEIIKLFSTTSKVIVERTVTKTDIEHFIKLTGDTNSVHSTGIVHGALLNAFVSTVIGTQLPGDGTLVASEKLRFPKPCFCGDSILIEVEIKGILRKLTSCSFKVVRKCDNMLLMEGEAQLILPKNYSEIVK